MQSNDSKIMQTSESMHMQDNVQGRRRKKKRGRAFAPRALLRYAFRAHPPRRESIRRRRDRRTAPQREARSGGADRRSTMSGSRLHRRKWRQRSPPTKEGGKGVGPDSIRERDGGCGAHPDREKRDGDQTNKEGATCTLHQAFRAVLTRTGISRCSVGEVLASERVAPEK